MEKLLTKEADYNYLEKGKGQPIVILHGLMGGLSNFAGVLDYFPNNGYQIIIPELPIYDLPLKQTNVAEFAEYLHRFLPIQKFIECHFTWQLFGGHIGLVFSKTYPEMVRALVLTGSSGLYENSMGDSYPKRENYNYIKTKSEEVFYDPAVATKQIVDEVYETVNDRNKLVKTLAIAKSAIRHNMSKDLPDMNTHTCLIWGKNDNVTPPDVAEEFNNLLPNVDLFWIDKCGHVPMMEHPDAFNELLHGWLKSKLLNPHHAGYSC